jgi:hypothetical protein
MVTDSVTWRGVVESLFFHAKNLTVFCAVNVRFALAGVEARSARGAGQG